MWNIHLKITLDDNAAYGFNIREAEKIRSFINNARNLTNERCPVYPGADEVQLVMLRYPRAYQQFFLR